MERGLEERELSDFYCFLATYVALAVDAEMEKLGRVLHARKERADGS